MIVVGRWTWSMDLVEGPFEAEAGVAHEARAGEIVGELNLGADMQMGATEPLSHVVPELGFAQDAERLTGGVTLAPDIEEAGETQTGCGAEIVAAPDEGELQRYTVLKLVVRVGDILI